MATHFDEKGKIFTNVVKKEGVSVLIQTMHHRIQGQVYVRPDERLIDEMNREDQFLAVTDAILYDKNGEEILRSKFLTLNRSQVIWIAPEEELENK